MSEWISVDDIDKLPSIAIGKFLVFCRGGNMEISLFIKCREDAKEYFSGCEGRSYSRKYNGKNSINFETGWKGYAVTHWMPLPEPPKQGGAE